MKFFEILPFNDGDVVYLRNCITGKYLRVKEGSLDVLGEKEEEGSRWIVHLKDHLLFRLESVSSKKFLRVTEEEEGEKSGIGEGDVHSEFELSFCDGEFMLEQAELGIAIAAGTDGSLLVSYEFDHNSRFKIEVAGRGGEEGGTKEKDEKKETEKKGGTGEDTEKDETPKEEDDGVWTREAAFMTKKTFTAALPIENNQEDQKGEKDTETGNVNGKGKAKKGKGKGKGGEENVFQHFKNDNIIFLRNFRSGKTLREKKGVLDVGGKEGEKARWRVHRLNDNEEIPRIKLQNVVSGKFLRINRNGGLDLEKGKGGILCEFKVIRFKNKVVLESIVNSKNHVGGNDNGSLKQPRLTGKGTHARFLVSSLFPSSSSSSSSSSSNDEIVMFESCVALSNLQFRDGKVDVAGCDNEKSSQWCLHRLNGQEYPARVKLENVETRGKYLCISSEGVLGMGEGGEWCDFTIMDLGDDVIIISVKSPKWVVGAGKDGAALPPKEIGSGYNALFRMTHVIR